MVHSPCLEEHVQSDQRAGKRECQFSLSNERQQEQIVQKGKLKVHAVKPTGDVTLITEVVVVRREGQQLPAVRLAVRYEALEQILVGAKHHKRQQVEHADVAQIARKQPQKPKPNEFEQNRSALSHRLVDGEENAKSGKEEHDIDAVDKAVDDRPQEVQVHALDAALYERSETARIEDSH